mgnify:CR=1 FL=1
MATQLQIRRGTAAQVAAFTGAEGEIVYNSTNDSLHTNDGSTAGGFELARADGANFSSSVSFTTLSAATFSVSGAATFSGNIDVDGITNLDVVDIDGAVDMASTLGVTGVATLASLVATTADINGGTIDGTVIGGATPAAISGTTGQFSTSLNVDGTATMDGLTVDLADNAGVLIQSPNDSSTAFLKFGDSTSSYSGSISYDHFSDALRFKTINTTRMILANNGDISFYNTAGTSQALFWDASAESLGIGTTLPASYYTGADNLVIHQASGEAGMTIATASDTSGALYFADGSSGDAEYRGGIVYNHSTDVLSLVSGGANRAYINSSGNVGIGTASPQEKTHSAGRILSTTTYGASTQRIGTSIGQNGNTRADIDFRRWTGAAANHGVGMIDVADTGVMAFYTDSKTSNTPATTERMRISGGNVGIGTSSFTTTDGSNIELSSSTSARVILDSTGTGGRKWTMATGGAGSLDFYDYDASAYRMRISSDGNVLVGTTDTAPGAGDTNTGISFRAGGDAFFSKASSYAARFNRNTNDGDVVTFAKDGTTVGSIGNDTTALYVTGASTGIKFGSAAIWAVSGGGSTNSNGAKDLGAATVRWKDLYLSGGIYLGGVGAANKLDDFETGSWTPTWIPASGSGQTVASASGYYTKVGNRVFIDIHLATNGHGTASGNLSLGGLPFTQSTNSGQNASLSCGQAANAGLVAGQACTARINESATTITPLVWSATAGTTTMTVAQWGVSGTWRFTGSYQV